MRKVRFVTLFLVLAGLLGLSALVVSCGGGGGGGGGAAVDNTKANGVFTYVAIDAGTGFTSDRGTLTFDGAGHGIFSSLAGGGSGTFNYTVTVPGNTLTVDGTTIGIINSAGNFLTASDITSDITGSSLFVMSAVKTAASASFTDSSVTYRGGEFGYNAGSQVMLFSATTATPSAGILAFTDITSGGTGTTNYAIASNGTFTVTPSNPETFGAMTGDKNIMIWADTETIISPYTAVAVALKVPGSGMSNASLNGTYTGVEYFDELGVFGITRFNLTFNGAGSGTYTIIKDSGGFTGSFPFTYAVNPNGTFLIEGSLPGVVLQDGSVISFTDDDNSDSYISVGVAIKR